MSEWMSIYNWAQAVGLSAEEVKKVLEEYQAKKAAAAQ